MHKISYITQFFNKGGNTGSEFRRNVLTLAIGSIAAQIIPVAASPLLTRLYTPEAFGAVGLYASVCSLFCVFSSARYDLAILEPKEADEAKYLFIGSLALSVIYSILILAVIIILRVSDISYSYKRELGGWIYLLPISILSLSTYSICGIWFNRNKRYSEMSKNRVIYNTSNTVISIGAATLTQSTGLLVGLVGGQILTVSLLWKKAISSERNVRVADILNTIKKYARYPKYLIPATFAGEASSQAPIILLTAFFGPTVAGFYALTSKVTIAPISLIGNAIGEVYRQRAVEHYHQFGDCKNLFIKSYLVLGLCGFIPLLFLAFAGKIAFVFVFGANWAAGGEIAQIIAFMMFFQLLSVPLSYTIVLNKGQKWDMFLQLFRMVTSISSIFVGWYLNSYLLAIQLYALSYSIYYLAHSGVQYAAARGRALP